MPAEPGTILTILLSMAAITTHPKKMEVVVLALIEPTTIIVSAFRITVATHRVMVGKATEAVSQVQSLIS